MGCAGAVDMPLAMSDLRVNSEERLGIGVNPFQPMF
jgi:hypothetical protein